MQRSVAGGTNGLIRLMAPMLESISFELFCRFDCATIIFY